MRQGDKRVFLTLSDEKPDDPYFVSMGYEAIGELLPRMLNFEGRALGQEVATFIRHYIEIIEEACGMSKEQESMEQLAQALYRRHQKVLDFIWEHGSSSRFSIARETALGSVWGDDAVVHSLAGKLISLSSGGDWFSFLPASWFKYLGGRQYQWPGCESFGSGFPVACWFGLQLGNEAGTGTVRLNAEVGPLADHPARAALIKRIEAVGNSVAPTLIGFRKDAGSEGKRFSRFTKSNKVQIDDVSDHEQLAAAINELLTKFHSAFEEIAPIFDEIETGWVEVGSK